MTEPEPPRDDSGDTAPARRRSLLARHRRRIVVALGVAVVFGYFLVTGLVARHDLERARADVNEVKAALLTANPAAAHRWMSAAQHDAHSARSWLAGPAWSVAAHIPWLGRPARVAVGLAHVAVTLSDRALPPAVKAGEALSPTDLRRGNGAIRLAGFGSAAPSLAIAVSQMASAERSIAKLPSSTWLPAANHALSRARSLVTQLQQRLGDARDAARLAPAMLGGHGSRHYLVVVENDAEARGLGGLPGAMAVLSVSHGRLALGHFENNTYLTRPPVPPVAVPQDYRDTYAASDVLTNFPDSDVSPDFPVVAKVWLAMWRATTGQQLDGAIVADPTALSYLLNVTGPATLPDGTTVSGKDLVALTEQQVYSRFPAFRDFPAREAFFIDVARAVAQRIVNASGGAKPLVDAMSRAVGEHRLLIWSAHPTEQATLARTPLAGALPVTSAPFVGVIVNNGQGSKLDYYLDRSVTYDRGGCTADHLQLSTVTVRLHNGAPANLPAYVTLRVGAGARHNPLGSERLFVSLYTTAGALLTGVSDDGGTVFATHGSEAGHPRFEVDVTTDAGATTTLVFHLIEPKTKLPVTIWRQPGVRPEVVRTTGAGCG